MDKERIRQLAESAQRRGEAAHALALGSDSKNGWPHSAPYYSHLNDAFYWFGHANAYKGILAMMEIDTVREEV